MDDATIASHLADLSATAAAGLDGMPGVARIPAPAYTEGDWPQSIHSFALRDPANPRRFLSMAELQIVYRGLAGGGVLVGQPVAITPSWGALRLTIGGRNLRDLSLQIRDLEEALAIIDRMTSWKFCMWRSAKLDGGAQRRRISCGPPG